MVSAFSRSDLCLVTKSPMFAAIMEPVAWLASGSRPGRSRINTVYLCFNSTASARGAVGSTVTSWERASGAEQKSATRSQSKTEKQSAQVVRDECHLEPPTVLDQDLLASQEYRNKWGRHVDGTAHSDGSGYCVVVRHGVQ